MNQKEEESNHSLKFLKRMTSTSNRIEQLCKDLSKILTNGDVILRYKGMRGGKLHFFGYHFCDFGVSITLTDFSVSGSYDYGNQENNKKFLQYMATRCGNDYKDEYSKHLEIKHKLNNNRENIYG